MSDIEEKLKDITPEYKHWAKQLYWTIKEAALLFIDVDPRKEENLNERLSKGKLWRINPYAKIYIEILDTLQRDASIPDSKIRETNTPPAYMEWATERDFKIPQKLSAAVKKYQRLHTNNAKNKESGTSSNVSIKGIDPREHKSVMKILLVMLSKHHKKAMLQDDPHSIGSKISAEANEMGVLIDSKTIADKIDKTKKLDEWSEISKVLSAS